MNLGRYQEAAAHFHRAVQIQQRTGNADGEAEALSDLSHLQAILGHLDDALRTGRKALTIVDRTGNRRGQCTCLINLASASGRNGDHEAAEDQVRRALAIAEEIGAHNEIGDALRILAWIRHQRGHGAEARRHADRALEILQIRGNPISLSAALNTTGLLLRAADPAGALRHHRRALTIAVQAEHPLEEARAHDGIARAAAGIDDEVAGRHAAAARSLYRGMLISA